MIELLAKFWHYGVALLSLVLALWASGHAILYKRDTRGAVLWVGLVWLAPLVGPVLYYILGINRIRRQASHLRSGLKRISTKYTATCSSVELTSRLPEQAAHLVALSRAVGNVAPRPMLPGNRIDMLVNGDEAYPSMLGAIRNARESVTFATYIFDDGRAGGEFQRALADAVGRGVQVRVLIDDTGARYSWPNMVRVLRKSGVPTARFLPTFAPTIFMAINMRNHRKILVVDGRIGFTGGMNIRDGHLVKSRPRRPVKDLHFRIEGPVVAQLQEVFAEDWLFTTGEALGSEWFPAIQPDGPVVARGIADGPDEDLDNMRLTFLAALTAARTSVTVLTPYFLPDQSLIAALELAAMRGVEVKVVLPEENNLPFVQWATNAQLWQILSRGCQVWFTPAPFDHTKLMLVDGHWSLIGSANWDPRSLRLNFELNLECYDRAFTQELEAFVDSKLHGAFQITLDDVDRRSLPIKLRDGIARLLTPFL